MIRGASYFFDMSPTLYEFKWALLGERLDDGFTMYKEAYDYTAPFSALVYSVFNAVFGRSYVAPQLFATFLVALNASIFNLMLVRNRAYEENNYLPALFFVLFSMAIPDFSSLSPQLLASTFVLLSLRNVISRINNQANEDLFLNSGLFMGVAALFYLPSLTFFFLFLIAFLLFSTAVLRRVFLFIYGVLIPLLVVFGYYVWKKSGVYFLEMFLGGVFIEKTNYLLSPEFYFLIGLLGFWLLVGIYTSLFRIRLGNYESRILQLILLFGITAIVIYFIDAEKSLAQLVFIIPTISYFITYYFLTIKKWYWTFLMQPLIIISLLLSPYYFKDAVKRIEDENDGVPYEIENLMVCSENLMLYQNYHIASPFIDPILSKKQESKLDFYESSLDSYRALSKNTPELIIDDCYLMVRYFEEFPVFREKYIEVETGVYKLNN